MSRDKCPHCGEILIDGTSNQWACGSWLHASGYGRQTDLCRERAANAELRKELEHVKWLRDCELDTVLKLTSELLIKNEQLAKAESRVRELEGLVAGLFERNPGPWYMERCNSSGVEVRNCEGYPVFIEDFDFGPEIGPNISESVTSRAVTFARALVALGEAMPRKDGV